MSGLTSCAMQAVLAGTHDLPHNGAGQEDSNRMPEGDTVWLAARRMREALGGRTLVRTDFRVPQLATVDLQGWQVSDVVPRGKHLLTRMTCAGDAPQTLHTHFKMDGSWHLYRPGAKRSGGPEWQVRVVLTTDEWEAVGYRMPVVELVPTAEEHTVVGHLGPDLLGPDWDLDEAVGRLTANPYRSIGEALLDQRCLAGIGNLYKIEALFLAGVNPWSSVEQAGDVASIVDIAKRLMERNKNAPEQSTTGDLRRDRQHWLYGRKGKPCRRCGTPIRVADQGPATQERITYWCPRCQPS